MLPRLMDCRPVVVSSRWTIFLRSGSTTCESGSRLPFHAPSPGRRRAGVAAVLARAARRALRAAAVRGGGRGVPARGARHGQEVAERRHHALASLLAHGRHSQGAGALEDDRREQAGRHQLPGRRLRRGLLRLLEARGGLLRARQAGRAPGSCRRRWSGPSTTSPARSSSGSRRPRPRPTASRSGSTRPTSRPGTARCTASGCCTSSPSTPTRATSATCCSTRPSASTPSTSRARSRPTPTCARRRSSSASRARRSSGCGRSTARCSSRSSAAGQRPPDRHDAQAARQDPRDRRAPRRRAGRGEGAVLRVALSA